MKTGHCLEKCFKKSIIQGLTLPYNGLMLSHLFFADDAILMSKWKEVCIKNLARILKYFHIYSGLKVNFYKPCLFEIGVMESNLQCQAHLLGCLKS
uniref:Reverse transcriptase domain-containing protein n=1 Tax=Lactuca sativa TaxID=4236 RepID=A0A9R1VXV9_LACSA|nr:hypothetical protein LSAT_V11C400224960 [Lactuca sativa]